MALSRLASQSWHVTEMEMPQNLPSKDPRPEGGDLYFRANSVISAVISTLFPLIILFALVLIILARASMLDSVNICESNKTISMPTLFFIF